jgi:hypothetical protein
MPVSQDGCRSPHLFPSPLYFGTHQPSRFTNKNCVAIWDIVFAIHPLFLPTFGTTPSVYKLKISHLWPETKISIWMLVPPLSFIYMIHYVLS